MSEIAHSLPPEINGTCHGRMRVQIGKILWLNPDISHENIQIRLKFWGEKGPGVILKPSGFQNDILKNEVEYIIRCNQPMFIRYLMDMGCLTLDVTDQTWRLLGTIKINLKLYMKKDYAAAKGNLASNFGFSNIDVEGTFPVLTDSDPPAKLGEVDLVVISIFGEVTGKFSKAAEANFPVKPNRQEKYAEDTKIEDNRIANSLLSQACPGEYNLKRVVNFKEEKEKPKENQSKPSGIAKRFPEEHELPKDDLKSESNISMELENLKAKGERLRKKLEASSKPDLLQDLLPQPKEEKSAPLPTLSELEALSFPYDPTDALKAQVSDKPFSDLSQMTHLKLCISSLTLLVFRKDISPYIDCSIPLPAPEGNRNDSFKISHKGAMDDVFQFSHESLHHIVIGDGVFSKLASSFIRFKLCGSDKGKVLDLGKAEVQWEKVLLAQGFNFSADIEVYQEETKAKRTVQKIIGRLSVQLSLINDKQSLPDPKPDSKSPEAKSYLLYLFIDHVTRLQISPLNLFLTYKTFPEPERITTDIFWSYHDSSPISHKMVTAVQGTESIANKLLSAYVIIELWNKLSNTQEDLIGLVKLPLQLFSSYVTSGDSLASSVYPIIAFDEYRPVSNIKTGEDLGYMKVCLAMGSPAQVNRLRQTHEVQVKVMRDEPPVRLRPEHDREDAVAVEKSVQISEAGAELEDFVSHSIESIGDIAAFLNQKNNREQENEASPIRSPKKNAVEEIKPLHFEPREFVPVQVPQVIPERTPEDVMCSIKDCLSAEKINLEEELKIADRFNYGYMHKESLSYFFQELRLGLSPKDINTFIDNILSTRPSSTARRVLFTDILSILGLIEPSYTKHTFTVTISQLFACSVMSRLSQSQAYLKYQFPTEPTYIESDLLEPATSIQVNLKSVHSCTFPMSSSLAECFSDKSEGISVCLCRYGNRGEEKVIGKGLLPIEEVIELEANKRLNRVICLYGDINEELQIYRSDLIGKVRVCIEYASDYSYQALNSSGELLFEKHTQVDRKIPRNNVLGIMLDSYAELNRGMKYMKSIGIELSNSNRISFELSVFHEDKELSTQYPAVLLATAPVSNSQSINALKYIDLTLSHRALEYFNQNSGLLSLYFDEELLGTCKVPLLQLLLHSSIKGEYAILNEYGQFMGVVNLTLSFSMEEFQNTVNPKKPENIPKVTGPIAMFNIAVESASNLNTEVDGECPNYFVEFTWIDGKTHSTNPILRSSCPCWNKTISVAVPTEQSLLEKPLIFSLLHKSNRGTLKIGEAIVELGMLLVVKNIDGWYHVLSEGKQVGQLKIKISSDEDLQMKFTGKVKEEVFNRLPSPQVIEKVVSKVAKVENKFEERLKIYGETLERAQDDDIIAQHIENMRSIENLAKNLEMKLSGSHSNSSPLKKSRETSPYRRFVPVTHYSETSPKYSYPLRKSRETSPPTYSYPDLSSHLLRNPTEDSVPKYYQPEPNAYSLRKPSPPKYSLTDHSSHPLRKSREDSPPKYSVPDYSGYYLKKNREVSPPKYGVAESASYLQKGREDSPGYSYQDSNAYPLRRGRDKSPPDYSYTENNAHPLRKSRETSPAVNAIQEVNSYNRVPGNYNFKNSRENSPGSNQIVRDRANYEYKEELPNYEENEGEWDPDRIADVLKTIEEASKYGEPEENRDTYFSPQESYQEFKESHEVKQKYERPEYFQPKRFEGESGIFQHRGQVVARGNEEAGDSMLRQSRNSDPEDFEGNTPSFEKIHERLYPSLQKDEKPKEKASNSRVSPKITRPALPKSFLSDPEISRIAAIMKGSSK